VVYFAEFARRGLFAVEVGGKLARVGGTRTGKCFQGEAINKINLYMFAYILAGNYKLKSKDFVYFLCVWDEKVSVLWGDIENALLVYYNNLHEGAIIADARVTFLGTADPQH
jgi:hypothetical protein